MNEEIILFGSGKIGYAALCFFGSENVAYFCDNNQKLTGIKRYGKTILSFDELKKNHKDAVIIITVRDCDAYAIAKQCEENEILDYLFYKFLPDMFFERDRNMFSERECIWEVLRNPMERIRIRRECYFKIINDLRCQVDYFRQQVDIRYMKPAKGALRTWQLNIVSASAELFRKIDRLDIKPILYDGTLLGYVRHNGFIPWDDDVDFALMRDEYERLKQYCRETLPDKQQFYKQRRESGNLLCLETEMGDYYWRECPDFLKITMHSSEGEDYEIDFFPLDYYSDDYSFEELKKYVERIKKKLVLAQTVEEKIKCMEDALSENKKNISKESNRLYFGIDNMDIMFNYQRGDWILREVVFPLKRVLYEEEYFWVPNNPEKFAGYIYENIWEFPPDVGLQRHFMFDI